MSQPEPASDQHPDKDLFLRGLRYHETKRLAEIIWPTVITIGAGLYPPEAMGVRAWEIAEAMYDESQSRDPYNNQHGSE